MSGRSPLKRPTAQISASKLTFCKRQFYPRQSIVKIFLLPVDADEKDEITEVAEDEENEFLDIADGQYNFISNIHLFRLCIIEDK